MPPAKKPADPNRQLMIKTKACQRIRKELDYYIQEVKENEEQLQGMKDANKDPYDIKKFEEVLGESRMMIPDSSRRLETAVEDLANFLSANEFSDDQEWKVTAQKIVEQEKVTTSDEAGPSTNVDDLAEGEAF